MTEEIQSLNKRHDRMEHAIEKLTNISNDLNKIIAVLDIRITQQEKESTNIQHLIERRREQIDDILKEIKDEAQEQHRNLNEKISKLEKFNWMAIGGGIVISWLITYAAKYMFKII